MTEAAEADTPVGMEEVGGSAAGRKRASESLGHSARRPRSSSGKSASYVRKAIVFDGESYIEPQVECELGGMGGLTVLARVKRSKVGCAWDRLIDFGNGAEKENIVISYQQEMMYEVRASDGSCSSLAVGGEDTWGSGDSRAFPQDYWMQIALVHASNGMAYIFWNGTLKAQGHVPLPERVRRTKHYVGKSNWDSDPRFHGMISDLYIFDYALSPADIYKCSISRWTPSGCRPAIVTIGDSWIETAMPSQALTGASTSTKLGAPCGAAGCGGVERCSRALSRGAGEPLHFLTAITDSQKKSVMCQLQASLEKHANEMASLKARLTDAVSARAQCPRPVPTPSAHAQCPRPVPTPSARAQCPRPVPTPSAHSLLPSVARAQVGSGDLQSVDRLHSVMACAHDARQRAQAIIRMIRNASRLPTSLREDAATGQLRQPPQIAAAVCPLSGMYHAFAIYELRSGDVSRGSRFHVYVTDLINLRTLLPGQTCWLPKVAGSLISLLQSKADAEQPVRVLRAACACVPRAACRVPRARAACRVPRAHVASACRVSPACTVRRQCGASAARLSRAFLLLPVSRPCLPGRTCTTDGQRRCFARLAPLRWWCYGR